MANSYILPLTTRQLPPNCGKKAEQIQQLLSYRETCVPVTHVCTWDAYEAVMRGELGVWELLREELSSKLDLSKTYAVRSSANIEDGLSLSFAGQFSSLLNISGCDNLLDAIEYVWQSARRVSLDSYLARTEYSADELRMAVILQQMVTPVVSGVAFNKNPITGLDEIVVEAIEGTGDSLVQEGATPDRWIHKWGDWISRPQESNIGDDLILQVVQQTKHIAEAYGKSVDLEWVYDGENVYWIQLRDITSLNQHNIYSNRMAREMLPGIIKPLIWSVNTQLINSAWIDIFTELIGPNDIQPEDLAKAFYYRAYFNMGTIGRVFEAVGMPKETLEIMMGMQGGEDHPRFRPSAKVLKHVPRMLQFMISKLQFSRDIDSFLPAMDHQYAVFAARDLSSLGEDELLRAIDDLFAFTKEAAYRNIVGPLLMHAYNGLLRRQIQQAGIDYENFDVTYGLAELEQYDPNPYLDRLAGALVASEVFNDTVDSDVTFADLSNVALSTEIRADLDRFLAQFGHLSDSGNDFSRTPWREDPDLVLQLIVRRAFSSLPNGTDPISHPSEQSMLTWDELPIKGLRRWKTRWLYRRARLYRYYREAISSKYTYGYGLFRNYFLALADRLVERGIIAERADIFMLFLDEVRSAVAGDTTVDFASLVACRNDEIRAVGEVVLPEVIYGDEMPPIEIYDEDRQFLTGIPTSGGYYQGPVRVVRSLAEFDKMIPGGVLVIPYSDVSWVPLFAQAGAIIAESGGILSHSSIVAREFRIPAVVSMCNACLVLKDDMIVMVDGFKGRVVVKQPTGDG